MSTYKKLFDLLSADQRRSALALLCLMLVGMALETLGVGLVIPALVLMTTENLTQTYPALASWIDALGSPTQKQLVVGGMVALVCVYTVKAVFLAFLVWRQSIFSFGLQADLSQRLFAGYLRQPYTFHLQRNSAQLIRNVTGEVAELGQVLQSFMLLITEGLVMSGIAILLFLHEPLGAMLVISTLSLASWGFHKLTRSRLLRWGETRQYHDGLRLQHLQQGLGGVKDVKLLGREENFLSQYKTHNAGSARVAQRRVALQQLPRLWLEMLSVLGLAILVIVVIEQGKPLSALLPILGLFAAAAFRLMPSLNRVLGAVQAVRFGLPVINTLHSEVEKLGDSSVIAIENGPILTFDSQLKLNNVYFRYPGTEKPALHGISLNIARGTSVGFIGGSGAGKSTLVDVILGLLSPETGNVTVDGVSIQKNIRCWQNQIGYVPQSIYLTDDTLRRNIAFGLAEKRIDDEAVLRAVSAAQLEEFVNDLPEGVNTLVGERGVRLSGGQRQRIGIARALYHDPQVLVLDEATSSLDTGTEEEVMKAVLALHGKKTILIVAHRTSTVSHCDKLFRLEHGQVVREGSATDVLGIKHAIRAV